MLNRTDEATLTPGELVRLRCRLAKELEDKGDYEAARGVMSPFWQRLGERPVIEGLDETDAAEVLLRCGVLTGWCGSAQQLEGAQEAAKDLISDSLSIFEKLRFGERAAEAEVELAYCYWREGALDEARVLLQKALDRLVDDDGEIKAVALLRKALVESSATRFDDSLRILLDSAHLFESSANHALKGRFHNELAYNFQSLASTQHRADYTDRALVEFTAASFHFEQGGHVRYRAHVENNLGLLLHSLGKLDEAHEHLDHARRLFAKLKNDVYIAQVDETRARVFLAQGRAREAEKTARGAIRVFGKAGEQALLAEALNTHGRALAQLERFNEARDALERAATIAEQAGSIEQAGLSLLTLIEQLGQRLSAEELRDSYVRADEMLANSQHPEIFARLRRAARDVLDAQPASAWVSAPDPANHPSGNVSSEGDPEVVENLIGETLRQYTKQITFTPEALEAMRRFFLKENARILGSLIRETVAAAPSGAVITADAVEIVALRRPVPPSSFAHPWADFSLKDEIRQPEKRFIELALKAAEGKISVAGRLLGFKHNEFLTSIIKSRYPELLAVRTPPVPRKRSIIRKPQPPRRRKPLNT